MKIEEILKPDVVISENYLKLAYIIKLCFPIAEISIRESQGGYIFLFSYKSENLLEIDKQGCTYLDIQKTITFSGIIEGSIQSVSEIVLRHIATRGIAVFKPTEDINYVTEHKLLRLNITPTNIHLNECNNCGQKGGLRRIYTGKEEHKNYDPKYFYYAGENRKRDLGWFICLLCQMQFQEI